MLTLSDTIMTETDRCESYLLNATSIFLKKKAKVTLGHYGILSSTKAVVLNLPDAATL